ncbi:MAG: hypothetical protein QOH97_982 [Actinoplanes sp.]|jgi:hypothetical protein|nr:hypothetical protein [Actinoplanes sp.]
MTLDTAAPRSLPTPVYAIVDRYARCDTNVRIAQKPTPTTHTEATSASRPIGSGDTTGRNAATGSAAAWRGVAAREGTATGAGCAARVGGTATAAAEVAGGDDPPRFGTPEPTPGCAASAVGRTAVRVRREVPVLISVADGAAAVIAALGRCGVDGRDVPGVVRPAPARSGLV